ncbi:MAG: hypothetical protein LBK59_11170 [Bifidobacteriaceae bacterium]|jgi:hypothetical protein|nr:hypothetical protein [Bifidobacteriaceae bacterium]
MSQHNEICACCGFPTLPPGSIYEICALCGWQDDGIQNDDPDLAGGANKLSLNEYHARWEVEHHRLDVVAETEAPEI